VSATNGCGYCVAHHGPRLVAALGDESLARAVARDYREANLPARDRVLLDAAVALTCEPSERTKADVERVREYGFDDAAILKASQRLTILPYKIGKSAGLRQGNAVAVRGFPLGVMQAVSSGKVVNPYDRDQEQGWDHVDFVIDALLSAGNSGSPVFAVSCRTSEPELMGVFHAGYADATALNVLALFAQDSYSVRRLTLTGGIRFEQLEGYLPDQASPASPFAAAGVGGFAAQPREYPAIRNVVKWNTAGPRGQLVYDISGDGRTALKAAAAWSTRDSARSSPTTTT